MVHVKCFLLLNLHANDRMYENVTNPVCQTAVLVLSGICLTCVLFGGLIASYLILSYAVLFGGLIRPLEEVVVPVTRLVSTDSTIMISS